MTSLTINGTLKGWRTRTRHALSRYPYTTRTGGHTPPPPPPFCCRAYFMLEFLLDHSPMAGPACRS
ncbi:hypothetical protein NHJ6243_007852 [Beauveria neobassiana]